MPRLLSVCYLDRTSAAVNGCAGMATQMIRQSVPRRRESVDLAKQPSRVFLYDSTGTTDPLVR